MLEHGHVVQQGLLARHLADDIDRAPVFFRDLSVGQVLGWDIADMAEYVTIRAFVRAPYDSYVHDETRFWNASGLSVKLGGAGVEVQMESLRALLLGGIAFDTPEAEIHAAATPEDHVFPLSTDDVRRTLVHRRVGPSLVS